MQVSQRDDFISHAVIGQSESVSMGMSEDAALMHILSSALYTYPKLAAVREVICNGWDGHIIGNKLTTPLEITLAEGQFRVRDFGPGIHHDRIGPIYGTYGNSTKRTDSTQTGGFGLGSKAPFAYTDNFELISCHEGTKTIYRVSKSSMEKGGKPSINKIVSMPTDESGITVTYAVKEEDRSEFAELINEVVILGGIPAIINGKDPIEPLPLLESPTGYIINSVSGTLISRINIRYGNVVYPIPMNKGFQDEWQFVLSTMNKLWSQSNIIFMAKPDSVSIAPNRESLNFTETTVKTIKGLLAQFSPKDVADCEKTVVQVRNHLLNNLIAKSDPTIQWHKIESNPQINTAGRGGSHHVTGPYAFTVRKARLHHLMSQRDVSVPWGEAFQKRFDSAIRRGGFRDNKFAKAMRKALLVHEHRTNVEKRYTLQTRMSGVFHKFVTLPLYQHIDTVEKMDTERLFIGQNGSIWGCPELVRLKNFQVSDRRDGVCVLRRQALIARSKTAAKGFLNHTHKDGGNGYIVYIVGNHPERRAEAERMFDVLGYEVSICIPEPVQRSRLSDDPDYVAPVKKASPKRKGYLTLAQSFNGESFLLSTARENGSVAGLTDPIAWVNLNNASHHTSGKCFSQLPEAVCRTINKLWGDKIAVVTSVQVEALEAKGIPDVKTLINNYVDDTLVARPDFPRYLAFGHQVANLNNHRDRSEQKVMRAMVGHGTVMKEMDIRFAITPETAMLITFFAEGEHYVQLPKSKALAAKVKPSPKFQEILTKLKTSPWAKFIDMDHLGTALEFTAPDDPVKSEVPYTILRNLLK